MMYVLHLYNDSRVHSACEMQKGRDYGNAPIVDYLPSGLSDEENDISNYRYLNGQYIYDPKPKPVEPEIPDTPAEADDVWAALDAAYQEGVDSV